jgi:outer membrane protein assembly factor BamE (lipoprotein component of BamABCDE complex)
MKKIVPLIVLVALSSSAFSMAEKLPTQEVFTFGKYMDAQKMDQPKHVYKSGKIPRPHKLQVTK